MAWIDRRGRAFQRLGNAPAGPAPEHVVHDRHDVGEALAGARTGRQHVGAAPARLQDLPEFLVLAIGQRVHRVDNDGLDAPAGPAPEHVVHDRHDVGEALAGARTGRQEELLAAVVGVGLVYPENPRALRVQHVLLDQIVDGATGPERRVELEQRFGPEPLRREDVVDEYPDARVADPDEAARVAPVVVDQALPEVERVHSSPSGRTRCPAARDGCQSRAISRWPIISIGWAGAPPFVPRRCPTDPVSAADPPDCARVAPSRPLFSVRNRSVKCPWLPETTTWTMSDNLG